jgi:hypothetical protein
MDGGRRWETGDGRSTRLKGMVNGHPITHNPSPITPPIDLSTYQPQILALTLFIYPINFVILEI